MNAPSDSTALALLNERRDLLHRMWALTAIGITSGSATLTACGGGSGGTAAVAVPAPGPAAGPAPAAVPPPPPAPPSPSSPPPAPAPASSAPALGAHALNFNRDGVTSSSLSTPAMSTRATGSTLLACVGRGLLAAPAPTDNVGNAFVQLGAPHIYTLWPSSGTSLHACEKARGMAGHVVTVAKPKVTDETTLSVVEIANGGSVRDVQWREVLSGQPLTSASVTTIGPALLVAWWWGDAGVDQDKTAVPDNGFSVIDSVLASGALVQGAVAVKQVSVAGTYNVTWASTPQQGAQLWLVAVQAG
ncbi:hypothetical protein QTH90_10750 [Variovorax sp. J2P1-59]|uniref:hypothetical protein n=1 Tax=Variovorax flavidus TaxID=3053501 RepID=UPI00257697DD|nr:hypothetical protein [Variovorax sp. J2P1-59]MDM0074861.1 hypothetical protein [Variovorax sp. J2P1-59]